MGKNILVFSDGTGQAGGLMPDERRSNVYKLFRATRCGPDSRVDPDKQLAFYDPGLGSASDGEYVRVGFVRKIYNVLAQATGLGITRNIIDCYTAILQAWEPGDRIFLFGFSRGAYTARCVGGVLSLCGVPTTMGDGTPLKRDARSARAIATEAVRSVYQHGATRKSDRLAMQRKELAAQFRARYHSKDADGRANTVPYFIGVWDTVGALGINRLQQVLVLSGAAALFAFLSWLAWWIMPISVSLGSWLALSLCAVGLIALIWYLQAHLKWTMGLKVPWWQTIHLTGWRMQFYDTILNQRVSYAKHALSIDENRATFARVPWTDQEDLIDPDREESWFEQLWFAGVHSDVGGSYPENESRLSDISLDWMVERATSIPYPIIIERNWLNLFPLGGAAQHDECKSGRLKWKRGVREIPSDAPLHPSVIARFKLPGVIQYDEFRAYRPEGLRNHREVSSYYEPAG
ncbi:DUF2235 domain-containing protein [Sinorhizobium fredii]|uniref:DUF2235 domain-containing protein n=2 Tax=Rhizobium fredii TaxID=380 RepID=A0A844A2U6_RHIFR|nr:DUF2235 domain-containing protein [Sinorhizobium fredii]AWI62391.1 hypothetical protein AB395_00006768 [Sinorhizobium fredii CCBAU 45436]KSV80186.1 hypothetical protein N181_29625 [Sinorhizobium fredii USDA 205]MQX06827.1 DUF2235 domain-containing protein [Sinorhizobium fredii]CCE97818.1 conserved hypothetical protein [Sinorhizobium fredii HH103]